MPQPKTAPRRTRHCRDCDGFPVVAIDTGHLHTDGTRALLRVVCRTCQGTGTVSLLPEGARV